MYQHYPPFNERLLAPYRVVPVKVPEQTLVQNMAAGHPRAFLWTVALPLDQILLPLPAPADIQDLLVCICRRSGVEGGLSVTGDSLDSLTGLTWEMWKVGWTLKDAGSLNRTAAGFTIRSTSNSHTKRWGSFLDSTCSGKSLVESQTLWPGQ